LMEYLRKYHLLKWKFQKLINYFTNMCLSGQGIMVYRRVFSASPHKKNPIEEQTAIMSW
jgi:hypothetical protein